MLWFLNNVQTMVAIQRDLVAAPDFLARGWVAADVPFSWVVADAMYGIGDVEQALRRTLYGLCFRGQFGPPFRLMGGQSPSRKSLG
jgi:hypothetical protein